MINNNLDSNVPIFPVDLPGTFWGITTFFNPCHYRNKYENYRIFRENSQRQGLNLLAVELAFDDDPFELKDKQDAEILIQLRGTRQKNLMWQRERLLNIGLKYLPLDCDKVAWLDCDIIFKNEHWIKETSGLLEKYIVVQPFKLSVRLAKGVYDISADDIENLAFGVDNGQKLHSVGYEFLRKNMCSRPGLCWALRRSVVAKHLFYDPMILGLADNLQALAYFKFDEIDVVRWQWVRSNCPEPILFDYSGWADRIYSDIKGSVYYTEGTLLHLWHGEKRNRIQEYRLKILSFLSFNPSQDIRVGSSNLWEWSSDKPALHRTIAEYFQLRNEEGKNITLASIMVDELSDTQARIASIEASYTYRIAKILLQQAFYTVMPYSILRKAFISLARFILGLVRRIIKAILRNVFLIMEALVISFLPSRRKLMIVHCDFGLCSRLRVILSGWALAKATGRKFIVIWQDNKHSCGCSFMDLFSDPPFEVRTSPEGIRTERKVFLRHWPLEGPAFDILTANEKELYVYAAARLTQPGLFPEHKEIQEKEKKLFDKLKPLPYIQKKADSFVKENQIKNVIGIHVRRGDTCFNEEKKSQFSTEKLPLIMKEMDEYLEKDLTTRFFVATDDGAVAPCKTRQFKYENIKKILVNKYGKDKILFFTPRDLNRDNKEAIQNALIELLILRKTKTIIGTKGSSFSTLAYFGRNVPYKLF